MAPFEAGGGGWCQGMMLVEMHWQVLLDDSRKGSCNSDAPHATIKL